jgi:DNA helicase-2/ATP-dependent DNA helicase PcrA
MYVDEIQDVAGHDFNFLLSLARAKIEMLWVGDFFQHTFDTSRDGAVNKTLHDDYTIYRTRLKAANFEIDPDSLINSYRCSPTVCRFISERLGIEMASHRADETAVTFVDAERPAKELFEDRAIVKLFYKEHYKYSCFSENWGASKGQDHYQDVCVLLNDENYEKFDTTGLLALNPQTRNKLYVACSRTRKNLFFARQSHLKRFKSR